MKRAFLGTGLIGAGLAQAALDRGDKLVVYNRTAAKTEPLVAAGARAATTLADAVRDQPLVHLALTADAAVDAVLDGILPHLAAGAVVVDHSTTSPTGAAARAERCAAAGIAFVHAPVFMSPVACQEARGVMLACTPADVFERVRAALEPMTGRLWFVGERPGAAAALKLAGNAMIVSMTGALADGLAIAADAGLSPDDVTELFRVYDPTATLRGRGVRMAEGDVSTQWSLRMARKDVRLMQEATDRPLAVLPGLADRLDALLAEGHGEDDLAILGRDSR